MGLLVHASIQTAYGLSVPSVYCRISRVIFDPIGSGQYSITLTPNLFVSRECRLDGKMPLPTALLPSGLTLPGTFGDMAFLYGLLKTHLEAQGLTVEDVIEPPTPEPEPTPEASPQSSESTPSTLPTPPTPSESAPPESQPEPQPQSSSEYAPAPAAPEA
jgi:hypothetical protein